MSEIDKLRNNLFNNLQYIDKLEQENKQLKSISTELEEWLENNWKLTQDIWYVKIINKIQKLKEKYK